MFGTRGAAIKWSYTCHRQSYVHTHDKVESPLCITTAVENTGASGVPPAANHACHMFSTPRCALQAKLAKLRRELLEPSTGAGAGGGGKGEGEHSIAPYL